MQRRLSRRARGAGVCAIIALALAATWLTTSAWPQPGERAAGNTADDASVPSVTERVACPDGRRGFENPVLGYALCYPNGWGFTDFTTIGPLDAVPARSLRALHLVSANAFPWVVGTRSFDAIQRGVIDVEIDAARPGVVAEGECEPALDVKTDFLVCEQYYDLLGLPADDGPVRALKVVVPLRNGARLLAIIRSSSTREEVDETWELLRSIRAL